MSRDTNAVLLLAEYFLWLVHVVSLSRDSIISRSRDTNTALQLVGMLSRDTDLVLSLAVRSPVPAPKHHCSEQSAHVSLLKLLAAFAVAPYSCILVMGCYPAPVWNRFLYFLLHCSNGAPIIIYVFK